MGVTPVHFHKSKVYDNSNIILLLIPPLIFFIVITIYLTTIQIPNNPKRVISAVKSDVLGEEHVDSPENINLDY